MKVTPEQFLKELKEFDAEKYETVSTLRALVLQDKTTTEEIKYGGLLFSREKPYTGLFVSTHHVSMEFSEGAQLTDPDNLLEGTGKYRRHIKFKSLSEIKKSAVTALLRQAREL